MEILRYLPKAWLSFVIGKLAHIPLPSFLAQPLIKWFIKRYGVDMSEIAAPLSNFHSIGMFFTRALKEGSRPIGTGVVSPADSVLRSAGIIPIDGELTQVKGKSYSAAALLGDPRQAETFRNGTYFNFYLSPKDYHRVHSPVSGSVIQTVHIPGALWPVNDWSLYTIDNLFAVNERVVTYIHTQHGLAAVVMVGATNVGRISLSYCDIITNASPWQTKTQNQKSFDKQTAPVLNAGDLLGTFHLGSTVILLLQQSFAITESQLGTFPRGIKYGESLF